MMAGNSEGLWNIMSYVILAYAEVNQVEFVCANLHPTYCEMRDRDQVLSLVELNFDGELLKVLCLLIHRIGLPLFPHQLLFLDHARRGKCTDTRMTDLAVNGPNIYNNVPLNPA